MISIDQRIKALLCVLTLCATSGCALRKNLNDVSLSNVIENEAISGLAANVDAYEKYKGEYLNDEIKKLENKIDIYEYLKRKGYTGGDKNFSQEELKEFESYNNVSLNEVKDKFVLSMYSEDKDRRNEYDRILAYISFNSANYIENNGFKTISDFIDRESSFKVGDAQDSIAQNDSIPYIKYNNVDELIDVDVISEELGEEDVVVHEADPDMDYVCHAQNNNNIMYDLLNLKEKIDELAKSDRKPSLSKTIKIIKKALNYLKIIHCMNFEIDYHNYIIPVEDQNEVEDYLVKSYGSIPTK